MNNSLPKFINREAELMALETEYHSPCASLFIIYGRRRIGKTALIRQFIKDKRALYMLATEEGDAQNRAVFKELVADFTGNALPQSVGRDWSPLFDALLATDLNEKIVIVIDEFQYLGLSNKAFPSIVQKIWDMQLSARNVMLILCGSLISMMESQTLSYSSPLYGRRSGQIRLKQLSFRHYAAFFPGKTYEELIEFYALSGGVPKYIEVFHNYATVYDAIRDDVLSPSSFLYEEPRFLLQRELGPVGTYFAIIRTIAAGNHKLADIAGKLGQKQTDLTKYLIALIDLDILEREIPVTEEQPEKSRHALYRIKDNYLLFWFKFVYPNLSYLESGNADLVMDRIRAHFIDTHVSFIYESIAREALWQRNATRERAQERADFWPWDFSINKIGRWWNREQEIDIVALDTLSADIIFGECKYWNSKVGSAVFHALVEKARAVDWKKSERRDHYVLFAIHGFTDELRSIAHERDDLLLVESW